MGSYGWTKKTSGGGAYVPFAQFGNGYSNGTAEEGISKVEDL